MAAVFLAMLSAIAQIAYITVFPLWSLIVIVLDVVVLWALIVHGDEAETVART